MRGGDGHFDSDIPFFFLGMQWMELQFTPNKKDYFESFQKVRVRAHPKSPSVLSMVLVVNDQKKLE